MKDFSEVHQEHGSINIDNTSWFDKLPIGSLVRILPNHACLTCAAYSNYNILENHLSTVGQEPMVGVYWHNKNLKMKVLIMLKHLFID